MTGWRDGTPCDKHGLGWCADCRPVGTGLHQAPDPGQTLYAEVQQVAETLARAEFWRELMEIAERRLAGDSSTQTAANWGGRCRGCGGRWEAGDMISYSEDEDAWVCSGCCGEGSR